MSEPLRTLLARLIDYAGLFPPAALPMGTTVSNYARYRSSGERWMLGRLIVPVARFGELEPALASVATTRAEPWQISALTGADLIADLDEIAAFNARNRGRAIVDAIETKVATSEGIAAASAIIPPEIETYFELPLALDPDALVAAIAGSGRRAKMRTGGVTEDAFPPAAHIARFIARCAAHGVAFKATAGLHHPLRCVRPLTYEPRSATGMMHGFLNVFLSAALIIGGSPVMLAEELLEETDPATLTFGDDAIRWRGNSIATNALAAARALAISFGSCSFDEPVRELHEMAS
ncbi:MAG: hypothetical protein HYU52_12690 [Acidobacteria bacterium]|nr:hypothetical protein [Acidobacteriota bacterium]